MDLRETTENLKRHPWELARIRALKSIVALHIDFKNVPNVLDVGCGDAFSTIHLSAPKKMYVDAIDINLSETYRGKLSKKFKHIHFYNKYETLINRNYDFILLLDVLEHIKNDTFFLYEIKRKYLKNKGHIIITAPAFNFLFGPHDSFLGHYRRYNISAMLDLIQFSNLKILGFGYLFSSLLFVRIFQNRRQNLTFFLKNRQRKTYDKGLGHWEFGTFITKFIELWLVIENWILIILSRKGIKIPGLSIWMLCKKSP